MENLSPEKWKQAIIGGQTPQMIASRILEKRYQPWFETILNEAKNTVRSAKHKGEILELGSGTGELSLSLMMNGFNVTLLDFSEEALYFAHHVYRQLKYLDTVSFSKSDVTEPLPFNDHSFDMVFSSGLLEHFDFDWQLFILKEAFRVTRDTVLTLVPNAASLPYRLGKFLQERTGQWRWGKEDPMYTLEDFYRRLEVDDFEEWSVGELHALNFMRGGGATHAADLIESLYKDMRSKDEPVEDMNQGYLLVSVGYKKGFYDLSG